MRPHARPRSSELLEGLTKTHWWVVPGVWLPVCAFDVAKSLEWGLPAPAVLGNMGAGLAFWWFAEYALHRFVFHAPTSGPVANAVHFIFHGAHHKFPRDALRLVFPPVPAVAFALGLFKCLGLFAAGPASHLAMFAGLLVGYVAYDCMHYCIHHRDFKRSRAFQAVKANHLRHHYGDSAHGYGISNGLFDWAFGTGHVWRGAKRRGW